MRVLSKCRPLLDASLWVLPLLRLAFNLHVDKVSLSLRTLWVKLFEIHWVNLKKSLSYFRHVWIWDGIWDKNKELSYGIMSEFFNARKHVFFKINKIQKIFLHYKNIPKVIIKTEIIKWKRPLNLENTLNDCCIAPRTYLYYICIIIILINLWKLFTTVEYWRYHINISKLFK